MNNCRTLLFAFLVLFAVEARAANWTEGQDYYLITPAQATSVPP